MKPTKQPTIEYVRQIDGTPAMPYVIDAYVSLRRAGNIEPWECPASGYEEAFYIVNRAKRVVAVLSFSESATSDGVITVNMGYVTKAYRKRGLYRLLWDRLVVEARKRKARAIGGFHKPGNAAILKFNDSVGRKTKYVYSEFVLQREEGTK